jgi:hypothetical protein
MIRRTPSEEIDMEGQREKTSSRRRQRRKSKGARSKAVVEPVLIAARRPGAPRLENGFRTVASAQPTGPGASNGAFNGATADGYSARNGVESAASTLDGIVAAGVGNSSLASGALSTNGFGTGSFASNGAASNGAASNGATRNGSTANGHALDRQASNEDELDEEPTVARASLNGTSEHGASTGNSVVGVRRRAVRIVKVTDNALLTPGSNREQQLLDRLMRSQGRGAISRAADDLWESQFIAPKRQEVQIQLLEHENEHRARDAVFAIAELLQREAPIKRPVLDQRLRRLETSAEDPITRDAAGALRRSMRVHHGL